MLLNPAKKIFMMRSEVMATAPARLLVSKSVSRCKSCHKEINNRVVALSFEVNVDFVLAGIEKARDVK